LLNAAPEKPGVARAAKPARASTREDDEERHLFVFMSGFYQERARVSTSEKNEELVDICMSIEGIKSFR
jgi:hypothetical protein